MSKQNLAVKVEREIDERVRVGGWLDVCPLAKKCVVAKGKEAFENLCSSDYYGCQHYKKNHPLSEKEFESKLINYSALK